MSYRSRLRILVVTLSCVGIVLPTSALEAAAPVPGAASGAAQFQGKRPVADVELDAAGGMSGQVLGAEGLPVADAAVVVRRLGHEVARARTDAAGRFRVGPLRGGMYELSAEQHGLLVRAWVARTAPPSGGQVALIVMGDDAVRGQMPLKDFFASDAVVICALVAALIAVPIVAANSDSKPRSPS